jgi:hypothetical protein
MKARCGWSEKTSVELSGKDGEPPIVPALIVRFANSGSTMQEDRKTFAGVIDGKVATNGR